MKLSGQKLDAAGCFVAAGVGSNQEIINMRVDHCYHDTIKLQMIPDGLKVKFLKTKLGKNTLCLYHARQASRLP